MSLVLPTNFAIQDKFYIPLKTKQEAGLQATIDRVEREYLSRMFGKELYDLFVADLVTNPGGEQVPSSARFLTLYNPLMYQDEHSCIYQTDGMVEMLKGLVYFIYIKERVHLLTTNGIKTTDSENALNATGISMDINNRYNDGIEAYKVLQDYMCNEEPDTYPEFDGVYESFNHQF